MKTNTIYLTASLLALSLLQACSDKTVNAPARASADASAPAAIPAVVAPPAPELVKNTKPISKGATMECADRKVVLESTCLEAVGDALLQCTRQTLAVSDNATEKVLNMRTFAAQAPKGDIPGLVEEKIAEMTCVTTKAGQKYIVTAMINGATCETCRYAVKRDTALVCHGVPPIAVVTDNRATTMRCAVQPTDPACSVYKSANYVPYAGPMGTFGA